MTQQDVQLFSLSQPQQRIWYTELLYPNRNTSTIIATVKIRGTVRIDALQQAMNRVIAQNDSFRIKITAQDGIPYQYVEPFTAESIETLQVTPEEAKEWLKRYNPQPFSLLDSQLYRFVILQLGAEETWFNFKMHHIISDGVSMNQAINEITGHYMDIVHGTGQDAPTKGNPYLDFIQVEQSYEQSDRYQKDKTYWTEKFADLPETTGLKSYNPLTLSTAARRESFILEHELYRGVTGFCEEHKISIFTFFLAALYIYLHKVTGEQDLTVGTLYANRTSKKEKDTIGMFVSTVATRLLVEPESELLTFLQGVGKEQASILRHQRYPYNKIIQDLREQQSSLDIQRLFGASIQYRTLSFSRFDEAIQQVDNDFCGDTVNDFDIHMVEMLDDDRLVLYLDYRTELFSEQEIARIIRQFLSVAEHMVQGPHKRIQELSLIGEEERAQIVDVFNATAVEYPHEAGIHELFEEQAERTPNQTAVVFGNARLTYGELNIKANRLAHTLRGHGVTAEQTVGIVAERSTDMIVGMLAILKAGGAYVPIDPDYPAERVRYLLEDSGAKLLLVQHTEQQLEEYTGIVLDLSDAKVYGAENDQGLNTVHWEQNEAYHADYADYTNLKNEILNESSSSVIDSTAGEQERKFGNRLAYLMYTSGTTGQPKGVMVEHRNVVRLVKSTNYAQLDADTRILQTGAVVFDASTFEIWGALLNGGQLVLVSQDVILDAPKLKEAVRNHGITTMWLTAPLFNQLSQQDLELFEGVQELLVGGDVLSVPHINRVLEAHPSLRIINGYGPTENTTFSTTHAIARVQLEAVPIGRPIHNSTAYVVDRSMQLQPVGAWGELIVGGDGVARGYRNRPDLTAEKFVDSPFRSGERCYRTGDLVRWNEDGTLEYKGRIDAQVKIRGYRIELGEVEAQLLKLEAVQEAVVIAREDEQGQKQLCAYVVTLADIAASELRSAMSQELPGYMVPSYFVQLEQLPLTPNGKVDRRALPQPEGSVDSGEDYVAARNEVERTLVSVWQSVLGIEHIGVLDNFFHLGGDSIKAIQVSSRLLQNGYKLEMRELFQYPTIAELNGRVQRVSRVSDQGEVSGNVALTPIQHWFIEQQPSNPEHYNQALMLHREDRLDETALRQALQRIVEHHDALRIVFRQNADGGYEAWNRGVQEGELYSLEVVDFTNESDFAHLLENKASEIQSSIRLDEGPLVKLGLFRCTDGDHLLVAIHHFVVDGVSWRILLEDLASGYEQALQGESVRLPNKTDSFRLWADQLSAYANSGALENERAYWEQIEQAGKSQASLPKDYTRKSQAKPQLRDDRTLTVAWTVEETEQFLKQAHRAYNTEANDLLLTALGTAIQEWAGIRQVLVNLEGHGREAILPDVDITRTIGWFTSQFPVVLDMGEEQNVGRRVKNVKEGLRRLPHKGIGYGILRYLADREGEAPFISEPEISFNYLGQFDQDLKNNAFRMSPYSIGASISDTLTKRYALDINGMITDGALELTISYSNKMFMKKSIKKLADLLQESLREVLAHCVEKELPELTPSDLSFQGLTAVELDHIVEQTAAAGELENIYSLTPMQKGILFHGLMEPKSGAYFEQATFDLQGSFQVEAFAESLNQLVDRHQIFRTNFYSGWNEQPLQVVYRHKHAGFRFEDVRSMGQGEQDAYIADFAERDKVEGFNFSSGELMRVSVLRTGEESYRFVWSFHHILMDGWCLFLVVGEAFNTYFAILEDRKPELVPITPYSEYIEWLERQDNAEAERFWSDYFAGFEQQTVLPQAKQLDGHAKEYEADKLSFTLGREVTERINKLVKQKQVTVNTLLQAAWGVVLQRYNNSRDVVFGSVVSGRSADIPGIDKMIGLFINTVPVRIHSEKDITFAALMKQIQEQALASRAYETYPLYEIQALTEQKQDLVNHIMVFENYPVEQRMEQMGSRGENGFTIANASVSEQTNYDFNITVVPGDEIHVHLEYNARVLERTAVEQIREHLLHIIEEAINRPDELVDELELVTASEKAKIIDGFGSVGVSAWSDEKQSEGVFHAYVEEQAQLVPDHVAVVYEERQLTYRELNERANQLARRLRNEGIGRESIVGILSERSVDMLVGVLAVWKAGGAYVPLDADYPSERIRFMLEDSGATVLLTQTGLQERAQAWLNESRWALAEGKAEGELETAVSIETMERDSLNEGLSLKSDSESDSEVASESAANLRLHTVLALDDESLYTGDATDVEHINEPQDLAYVIYTSGTTGRPKGVMIEHRSLVNTAAAYRRDYRLNQFPVRLLQLASFSFDVFVGDIARTLYNGGTMVICPKDDRIDPSRLYGWIRDYQITVFESTPALIIPFMQHVHEHGLDMSSLELLITSSDSCSVTDYRVLQERFGADIRIMNSYGVTEAAIDSSFYDEELSKLPSSGSVPIGQAWLNARFYIVDSQLNPVPIGVLGELCIGGAGVARGYLNRADLTAEKFVANPYVAGERLYRTGDLARWMPDGNVDFIGRMDYQVKIRGYRIELGEIETAIQRVPGVRQAVVIDRTDERGHKYLCGYITGEAELRIEEVQTELEAGLPAHMVPARLMRLETIPLTSNGKIDRKALPEPEGSIHTGAAYVAPRTTVEQVLASVWAGVLGAETVGTQDNFFELGGDSIKALQVSSRLLQAGYRLDMKDLFSNPTVASLSPLLRTDGKIASQEEAVGKVDLTPIQRWFFEQQPVDLHHSNQAMMLYRAGRFDVDALRRTMERIVQHHDALRTVFRETEQGYAAWNRSVVEGELYTLDIVDFSRVEDESTAVEAKASEIQASIHLSEGPLVKLGLFHCAEGDHLLIVIHHLVVDGVSWRILLEDLASGYEQAVAGKTGTAIRLPHKTDSFQAWAKQLSAYANRATIGRELAYWQHIEQAEASLAKPLPKDFANDNALLGDSEVVTVRWTKQETEQLLKQAHRAYNTEMNDLLLAALGKAVYDWSGSERVLVNLEGHGREAIVPNVDITRTVGWFTSQFPVVLDGSLGQGGNTARLIKRVKEGLRHIPQKGIGYGILRYLSDTNVLEKADVQLKAQPEISFNYLGQFDQDYKGNDLKPSSYSIGVPVSTNAAMDFALDINGVIEDGELVFTIRYGTTQFRHETIARLGELLASGLREVIHHCVAQERTVLTPSDVLLNHVTLDELEQLVEDTRDLGELENVYALTPMQKGMLFYSLMDENSAAYFEQATFELNGRFDVVAFGKSFDLLVQRHEALRTNFISSWKDEPVQVVFRNRSGQLYYEDLRGLEKEERKARVEAFTLADKAKGFNLAEDALIRVSILQTGVETYHFVWSFHHILMDGWCLSFMTQEVFGSYLAIRAGEEPVLEPVTPFSRFIEWLERQDREASLQYWSRYLADYEQQITLPQQKTQPKSIQAGEYVAEDMECDFQPELVAQIERVAKQNQVTVNTLIQTVWGVLLQKYNNSSDVVFGSVVSGRPGDIPGVEHMIGLFINTIPVRVQSEEGEAFNELMKRTQQQALASNAYDAFPLYEIQALTEQKQDLINHIMIFENYPVEQQVEQLGGKGQEPFTISNVVATEQTNYDLNVAVMPGEGIKIRFMYNTLCFDRKGIERLYGHFTRLLEQISLNPNVRVEELELVTAAEKQQITAAFNDTACAFPSKQTIHQLFEDQVECTPDQVALVFGNQSLTYRELNERANSLARMLQAQGVGPDKLVGLMVQRSVEMIVGLLAVLKAGGAYVPIDPEFPSSRIEYMLEDSEAAVLLTRRELAEEHHCHANTLFLEDAALYQGESSNLETIARSEHLAYVIYTSGSTGNPKGVMLQHRSVLNFITGMREAIDFEASQTILSLTTISFDIFVLETILPLLGGMSVVLGDRQHQVNPQALGELITQHSIEMLQMTPSRLQMLLGHEAGSRALRNVKVIMVGGEALPSKLLTALQEINGPRIYNMYGPTETTVWSAVQELTHAQDINIGRPIANTQIYIMNASGELQPVGVPGELCIAGEGLARGYWKREELTAEKFVNNPFAGGKAGHERMYHTGDLARWTPDGNIEYLGRMDHQVKIRGYRIELGEIESQLLQVESVQEAVIMARGDETGQTQLVAYYVASQELGAGELRHELGRELPSYMMPSYFIQLEQMPLTPNGKIDRKSLPAPEGSLQSGADYVEPRTAPERALVAVWQSVLGVPTVGMLDNFFDLGGDSIKAIQIVSRAFQAGYKLDMKDLFRYPIVATLAPHMHEASRMVDQGEVSGETALLPIQHGFFAQEQVDAHHFNQAVMLHREQGFDEAALRQALGKLTEHHDALRMVFSKTKQGYKAWNRGIQEGELYHLDVLDFRDLTDEAMLSAAIEAKSSEIQSSIQLQEGPLLKAGLFHCADGDHLLMAIHHLVVDGVSWRILFEDLATAYEQAVHQEVLQLPDKTDSFRSWAGQLSSYANSPAMESEHAYWEQWNTAAWADQVRLPEDQAQAEPFTLADTDTVVVQLTEEETERLLKQAHRAYNTEVNDLLLTALGMMLYTWTGHERSLINLEGHGREDILPDTDISRTVGWFTSQYPVLLDIGRDHALSKQIKQVKESLRHIPNKGMGYGIWRYLSESGQTVGHQAFAEPQVSFNYLGQFDQDLQNSDMRRSPYSIGSVVSDRTKMKYALDVSGIVTNGVLELDIRYNGKAFRKDTVHILANLLKSNLLEMIEHCVTQERTELTPSDVLLKGLTLEQLDTIKEQTKTVGELENVYPLTPMQKGMLFHSLMNAETGVYFEQATFDLEGHFEPSLFEESLKLLVSRHAILRTNFYSGWHGQPLQIVYRHKNPSFRYEDVRGREHAVAEFVAQDKVRNFDVGKDALMRVTVFRTGDSSYRFVWSFHHMVMDGWCLSLVTDEVFGAYVALLEHKQPELAPVKPYSDYIEWLEDQDTQEATRYWSDYLADFEQQTLLPGENAQASVVARDEEPDESGAGSHSGYVSEKLPFMLGKERTAALNQMAKQQHVTINTLLQSVWGVILQQYNNHQDVVFGGVVSGRPADIPGVENMIGLFINTIPVRICSAPDATFAEVLQRTQEQALASGVYDTFPLYDIQALTEQKQDLIHHIMVFENYPIGQQMKQVGGSGETRAQNGFSIANVALAEQTNYDFNLIVVPDEDISILLEYNALVYSRSAMERIQGHIDHVIGQIVDNPNIRVNELELVTPQEQAQIVQVWGDTAAAYPQDQTLSALFEQQAARTPDQVAVMCGSESLTYAELNERANRLARTLRAEGAQPDQPVGILVHRSLDMIVGIYAILKAGGAYVPIDPDYPADRIRFMLEDSGAKLVLTQSHLAEQASLSFDGQVLVLDRHEQSGQDIYHEDGSNLEPLAGPHHVAYVIYTSGSTGKPKA
nr:non-ribosomal peptide synthetase [Paenibacillus polymyxa]